MTTIKIKAWEIGEVTACLVADRRNGLEDRKKIPNLRLRKVIFRLRIAVEYFYKTV
jgi:hypothetical protein